MSLRPNSLIGKTLLSFSLLAGILVSQAMCGETLHVNWIAPILGGSCQPGYPNVLAGSVVSVTVRNLADLPRQQPVPGWPEGYALEAMLDWRKGQPFIPTPGLIERLDPTPFLSATNQAAAWALTHADSLLNLQSLNEKHFTLYIPSEIVGHSLTIRAAYRRGGLNPHSSPSGTFRIIAPCSQSDSATVLASRIYEAWVKLDNARAIELADSMLALGWSDAVGWKLAKSSADRLERYDKQLLYWDRLFLDFGVTGVSMGTPQVPRLSPDAVRDPHRQEWYEKNRNDLLRAKAQQERQEQK